ncbi:MAG: DNA polymerase III subunit chi [Alphaproteobacteria bacterium]|nr:DNA polymerase III subunit chi [Alphaproteobacteria bacterium]|tara:strand:+ start:44 stop:493 length:450 start_codon:yes stop_codon:yes gene_type:complete
MTEIRFYHLTKKPLDQALPDLLSRAMETGKKILIQMNDEAQIKPMSDHLWVCRRNGFFPHGIKGDSDAEMYPVWLTSENDNPNKSETLILTNVADREDADKFGLVCEMFDGNNPDIVKKARARWKSYKDAGHDLTYYQQTDNGGWEKKA